MSPATEPAKSSRPGGDEDDLRFVRNRLFSEIAVGDRVSTERTLNASDVQLFAVISGDDNPQQGDGGASAASSGQGMFAHGMWGATLISGLLGTRLPGPGAIYLGQTLRFLAPVHVGDTLGIAVEVRTAIPALASSPLPAPAATRMAWWSSMAKRR